MRLFLLLIPLIVLGCNRPDPNPENKDVIYQDLNMQVTQAEHAIAAEEKQLLEKQTALKEVEPQTGQIKFAQKRVFDSQRKLDKLKQEFSWLKIRRDQRLQHTKESYARAFTAGQPWPNPKEVEEYRAQEKLRQAKREWDVQQRLKDNAPKKEKPEGEKKEKE